MILLAISIIQDSQILNTKIHDSYQFYSYDSWFMIPLPPPKLLPWCPQTFAVVFTNFCRGVFKLLPWCSQTFAVMLTNFCRGVNKLLPWRFQTFAVAFSNFCRGVHKLLPWCSQTFALVLTNFCRGVFKLLPWRLKSFSVFTKSFYRQFQNRVSYLKLKGLNESNCWRIFFNCAVLTWNFCRDTCGPPYYCEFLDSTPFKTLDAPTKDWELLGQTRQPFVHGALEKWRIGERWEVSARSLERIKTKARGGHWEGKRKGDRPLLDNVRLSGQICGSVVIL